MAKTVVISNNKTTGKAVSKLVAKKKYYVRICTYKVVKVNGKAARLYSSWSKALAVKVKWENKIFVSVVKGIAYIKDYSTQE